MSSSDHYTAEELKALRLTWQPKRFTPRVGGRFDAALTVLRLVLPALALILTVVTLAYPLLNEKEASFVLARDTIESSEDRLRMVNPRYSGIDGAGRPFIVSAKSAVQPRGVADQVDLTEIAAQMQIDDVTVTVAARSGAYRPADEVLQLPGAVDVETSNGYRIDAQNAVVDLDDHVVRSDTPVEAAGPLGRFDAGGFEARIEDDSLLFYDGVKAGLQPAPVRLPVKAPAEAG